MRKNVKGFSVVEAVIILVVVAVLGLSGWWFLQRRSNTDNSQNNNETSKEETSSNVNWSFDGEKWSSSEAPPACDDPLSIPSPVDISKATGILYPGQYRGGNYKPHGGFRFDSSTNADITVTAPFDSVVIKGSRYIERDEVQYMFVLTTSCGIMYRFDHLLTLSAAFQALADTLPAAKVDDSRTTDFTSPPKVKAGDIIATAVGFKNTGNVAVDFGVYDLRQKNKAYESDSWKAEHSNDMEAAPYGICWLNYLAGSAKDVALELPGADGQAGKTSDYCE